MDNRTIDALVAEHVMGWTIVEYGPHDVALMERIGRAMMGEADPVAFTTVHGEFSVARPQQSKFWAPSTDPTAMMKVVEKMEAKGFDWEFSGNPSGGRVASFWTGDGLQGPNGWAIAPTLMEAVCLAALLAHGVEVQS